MDEYGKNGNNNGNNIYEMPYRAHSIRTTKEFRDEIGLGLQYNLIHFLPNSFRVLTDKFNNYPFTAKVVETQAIADEFSSTIPTYTTDKIEDNGLNDMMAEFDNDEADNSYSSRI